MNRLRRVRISGKHGLKGRTFDQPLTGADIFVGPNGAGKSSRLLAVLAVGRGLAESPTDTAREYLGPDRPEALGALTFDAGEVSRDLAAKANSNEGKRATFDAERLMGPHVARWDLADFARATDTDRAKLLERICATAGAADAWTRDRVAASLRKSMGIPANAGTPADHPLSEALALWPDDKPVGDWLAAVTTWMDGAGKVEGVFTLANRAQREAEPALKRAAADLDASEPPAGTLAAKRDELERIKGEGERIKAEIAAAEAARATGGLAQIEAASAAAMAAETVLANAEARLSGARAAAERGPDRSALDAATRNAEAAQAKLAGLPLLADLEAALADAQAAARAASEALSTANNRADRMAAQARTDAEALAACDGAIAALRKLLTDASGACRHCQGDDPLGLGDKLAAEEARRAEIAEAAAGSANLTSSRREAARAAATAHTEAADRMRAADRAVSDGRSACAMAEAAMKATADAVAREEAALAEKAAMLARGATDAGAAVSAARGALEQARADLAAAEARLAEASQAGAAGDLDTLTAQREALRAEYARVQREVEALAQHEVRQKAHQDALQRKADADARFAVVKALKGALGEVKAAVAESAYLPIQSAADEFLREAGIEMEVAFRSEADFGAKVRQPDGSYPYVPFWSLSDAQKAEFGAALAVAFAKLTRSPWPAVILDKMEAIERRHLLGILRAAGAMVARGELANFLGAFMATEDPTAAWGDTGVAVHWLGSAESAVKGAA